MNMLKHHDLSKLERLGFRLQEHFVRSELDGVSAIFQIDDSLRVVIYQGCQGVYELQGQGRGRPRKHVLVGFEWFEPHWYIRQLAKDQWKDVADGSQATVDAAFNVAGEYFARLFPTVVLPVSAT